PGDLLVGYGARVRAVTGGRVGYLAEVTPHRDALPPQVLVEHGDHADREVTGYAAADLEEADGPFRRDPRVPVRQEGHVLDPGPHRVQVLDGALDDRCREHVPGRRVIPARHDDRQVLLGRRHEPRVLRVDLVVLLHATAADQPVEELVREVALAGLVCPHPLVAQRGLEPPHGLTFRYGGV